MALENFEGIAIMLLIFLISLNAGLLWMDSTSDFQDNGLSIGISEGTLLDQSDLAPESLRSDFEDGGNLIDDEEGSGNIFGLFIRFGATLTRITNTLINLLFGWTYLLGAIFGSVPGGTFFIVILTPLIAVAQVVGFFMVFRRAASIIFGG